MPPLLPPTDKFPNIFLAVLARSLPLGGSETEIFLSTIRTLDGQPMDADDFRFLGRGVLTVDVQSQQRLEMISFTGTDLGNKSVTGAVRGLSLKDNAVIPSNKKFHAVGAPVVISFGTHNLIDIEEKITEVYDELIAYIQQIVVGQGIPATNTVPGISMEATQAQVDAKTQTGTYLGNPYELFVNPSTLRSTKYNDYVVAGGSASAYTITPVPAITAYADGQQFTFLVSNTNTGATTLTVSGVSAVPITKNGGQSLSGGEIQAGDILSVIYYNGKFEIQSSTQSISLSQASSFDSDWQNAERYNFGGGNQDTSILQCISTRGDDENSTYAAIYNQLYKKNNFGFYVNHNSVASGSFGAWSQACILTDKTAIVNLVSTSGSSPNIVITLNIHFRGLDGSTISNSNNLVLSTLFDMPTGYLWCQTASVGNRIYACISGNGSSPAGGTHLMVIIDISGTTATLVSETPFTPVSSDAFLEPWFAFYKQTTSNTNILCHSSAGVTEGIVIDYSTGATVATITGDVSNNYGTSAAGKGWFRYLKNIWIFVSGKAGTSTAGPYDNQLQVFTFDSNPNI